MVKKNVSSSKTNKKTQENLAKCYLVNEWLIHKVCNILLNILISNISLYIRIRN